MFLNTFRNFSLNNTSNSIFLKNKQIVHHFMDTFNLPEYRVNSMMLKYPTLQNSDVTQLNNTLNTFHQYGIHKEDLLTNPRVLNVHSKTIVNRWNLLNECKIKKITLKQISKFKSILRIYTISQLRRQHLLSIDGDLWSDLVECFKYWPDIQHKLLSNRINIDPNKTLYDIRIEILKRFLKMNLHSDMNNFDYILRTYTPVKNRAFKTMCETLHLLEQHQFPKNRIASFGYILLLDPDNISNIFNNVKSLSGVSVKEVVEKYPTILKNDYEELLKINKILTEAGISEKMQQKCFLIYTLKSDTVMERLNELQLQKEFHGFESHPRIMSFVYNRTKIGTRMNQLKDINKKCFSLHKLTAGQKEFDRYISNFGDKTRGIDSLHFLSKKFSPTYSERLVREKLSQHEFWMYISILDIVDVVTFLEKDFNAHDLFHNCHLMLYPLKYVKSTLQMLQNARNGDCKLFKEYVTIYKYDFPSFDITKLTNFQILSLTCYFLEKSYQFSGAGVWIKPTTQELTAIS